MAITLNQPSILCALSTAAKDFHARGWMLGSAGNLSARDLDSDENCFWITGSGLPKACLEDDDFLCINTLTGEKQQQSNKKPSAETAIHQSIYRLFTNANSCMHVHSVEASLAIARHAANTNTLRLPCLEMLKGFGIWDEKPEVDLPIFENHANISLIAQDITAYYQINDAQLDGLMIRNHGITVWGKDIQETYNKVELLEFILRYVSKL